MNLVFKILVMQGFNKLETAVNHHLLHLKKKHLEKFKQGF